MSGRTLTDFNHSWCIMLLQPLPLSLQLLSAVAVVAAAFLHRQHAGFVDASFR